MEDTMEFFNKIRNQLSNSLMETLDYDSSVADLSDNLDYDELSENVEQALVDNNVELSEDQIEFLRTNIMDLVTWFIDNKSEPLTLQKLIVLLISAVKRTFKGDRGEVFVDSNDPYQLPIDYRGINLRLNPKRGKYKRWFNLIRFNADQHFPERYRRAYQWLYNNDVSEGRAIDHVKLDKKARSNVYKTLTGRQLADYVFRLEKYPENIKMFPSDDLIAFKFPKKKLWKTRLAYFSPQDDTLPEGLQSSLNDEIERGHQRLERSPVNDLLDVDDQTIGEDLVGKWGPLMNNEEYATLRDKLKSQIRHKLFGHDLSFEDDNLKAIRDDLLEKKVDEYIMDRYLKYALKRPYERWRNAFIGNLQKDYPVRYKAIAENDELNLYRDSARLREETHKAFNQKQLDEWSERVTLETRLMNHGDWLPKGRKLTKKPDFSEENREERLEQFMNYKEEYGDDSQSQEEEVNNLIDEELPEYAQRLRSLYAPLNTVVGDGNGYMPDDLSDIDENELLMSDVSDDDY